MDKTEKDNASSFDKNGDGVRVIEHGSRGARSALFYQLFALILVACIVIFFVKKMLPQDSSKTDATHSGQTASGVSVSGDFPVDENGIDEATSMAATKHDQQALAGSLQVSADRNDISNYIAPGQAPRMEEVIDRLHAAGIHEGLGAFSPPGTSPPMIGLAVPDDYVLPEGYVRHFQATDDGQRIEPILMYSPDYAFYDSHGQQIAIPENRVVPGNMAPPGLVIRPIKIPQPREPGGP